MPYNIYVYPTYELKDSVPSLQTPIVSKKRYQFFFSLCGPMSSFTGIGHTLPEDIAFTATFSYVLEKYYSALAGLFSPFTVIYINLQH